MSSDAEIRVRERFFSPVSEANGPGPKTSALTGLLFRAPRSYPWDEPPTSMISVSRTKDAAGE